jgi:hypothetical protein
MATTTRIRPDATAPAPATAPRLKTRLRGGQQIAVDTSVSSFIEGYRRVSTCSISSVLSGLAPRLAVCPRAPGGPESGCAGAVVNG